MDTRTIKTRLADARALVLDGWSRINPFAALARRR